MADLKPCPFCGGRADWWETESDTHRFQIVCVECFCGTDECVSEEVALKRWNTRKPMEAVVAELDETGKKFCENVGCNKECENCEHGALMRTIVEIVRGKE